MSCHSTHLSSAITSFVNYSDPNTTDKKVQVLFHALKREGKEAEAVAPTENEYFEALDKISFHLRHDSLLSEIKKDKVVERLDQAYFDPIPDGSTWYAINNILAQSREEMKTARVTHLVKSVAKEIDIPEEELLTKFEKWCQPDSYFEEVSSPDSQYQYENDEEIATTPEIKKALKRLGYERYLAQPYPFFVYGTLMAGAGAHARLRGSVDEILEAKMDGLALYDLTGGGYPHAMETEGKVAQGDLIWLKTDKKGKEARVFLDMLESFRSSNPSSGNYNRVLREVEFLGEDGNPPEKAYAWVYVASERKRQEIDPETIIPSGKWLDTQSWNPERHRRERLEDLRNGNQPILAHTLDESMIE